LRTACGDGTRGDVGGRTSGSGITRGDAVCLTQTKVCALRVDFWVHSDELGECQAELCLNDGARISRDDRVILCAACGDSPRGDVRRRARGIGSGRVARSDAICFTKCKIRTLRIDLGVERDELRECNVEFTLDGSTRIPRNDGVILDTTLGDSPRRKITRNIGIARGNERRIGEDTICNAKNDIGTLCIDAGIHLLELGICDSKFILDRATVVPTLDGVVLGTRGGGVRGGVGGDGGVGKGVVPSGEEDADG
jgi:hypothetical protein